MSEQDDRLSELYRRSSQETPSSRVDQAVLEMARRSVRRRVYAPFGASWLVRGATVGVMVLGVLLVLSEVDTPRYEQLQREPAQPAFRELRIKEQHEEADRDGHGELSREKQQAAPASEPRPDAFNTLPEPERVVPEKAEKQRLLQESGEAAPASRAPAGPAGQSAADDAPDEGRDRYYLQTGSFSDEQRAIFQRERLQALGFTVDISMAIIDEGTVYYSVRVGPFDSMDDRQAARHRLDGLGIDSREVTAR